MEFSLFHSISRKSRDLCIGTLSVCPNQKCTDQPFPEIRFSHVRHQKSYFGYESETSLRYAVPTLTKAKYHHIRNSNSGSDIGTVVLLILMPFQKICPRSIVGTPHTRTPPRTPCHLTTPQRIPIKHTFLDIDTPYLLYEEQENFINTRRIFRFFAKRKELSRTY